MFFWGGRFQQALSARLRQITSEAENVGNRQKESYAERHRLIEREKEVQQQLVLITIRLPSQYLIAFSLTHSSGSFVCLEFTLWRA
jgi:hypothetical protein